MPDRLFHLFAGLISRDTFQMAYRPTRRPRVIITLCLMVLSTLCRKEARAQTDVQTVDTSSQSLETVTVSGGRPVIERRADRIIFNVESSVTAAAGDALTAIRKAPGVQVSGRGEISMTGKSTVRVMIDNKLVQMDGDELTAVLRAMPAAQIARIEIISTPPARYDAEGNSGIIHIITKKGKQQGLNGNLSLSYMRNSLNSPAANGNFNLRRGRFNLYGNSAFTRWNALVKENYAAGDDTSQWFQNGITADRGLHCRSQLGVDWDLTPDMTFGALYTLGFGGPHWNASEDIRSGSADTFSLTSAVNRDRGLRNVGNLSYEWRLDSAGRKLNAEAEYFHRSGRRDRDFSTIRTAAAPGGWQGRTDNQTSGDQGISIASVRVDMKHPIDFATLEYGLKASFIHNTSDNIFRTSDGAQFVTDWSRTNGFDYREATQAAYISANKSTERWETQIGLRAENTFTTGYSPTLNQTVKRRYLQLFPSGFVQYAPNDNHSFNLALSRRIERPSFWLLNPFRTYTSEYSYETGNPFLQPSYSLNGDLTYTLHEDYSFTFHAGRSTDLQILIKSADTINQAFIFYQANAGSSNDYSLAATGAFQFGEWWECNAELIAGYSRFTSAFFSDRPRLEYGRFTGGAEVSNTFTLNKSKTLFAELGGEFAAARQSDFEVQRATMNISAGFKAQLLRKRLTLTIDVNDIFKTNRWRLTNLYNGLATDSYYDDRFVRCTAGWKFGSNSIKPLRQQRQNEEQSRVR